MSFLSPDPPAAPSVADTTAGQEAATRDALAANRQYSTINSTGPFSSTTWDTPADGIWTEHQTLDPQVEALQREFMAQQHSNIQAGAMAMPQVAANAANGFDPSGAGTIAGAPAQTPLMTSFSRSGMAAIPGAADQDAWRSGVEDSLYGDFTARADPRFARQNTDLQTSLRDKGFTPGDAGYNEATSLQAQDQNDAYQQAARDAQTGATAQQGQLLSQALQTRMQQGNEAQQDLTNYNNAETTRFGQGVTAQQAGNAAQQQGYGQAYQNYMTPLQYYNSLTSGVSPPNPTAPAGQIGASSSGAANVGQYVGQNYQGQMNAYNAQQAGTNADVGALSSLAMAALMFL